MSAPKNLKHAGGRPTDYSEETLRIAREYLESENAEGEQVKTVAGLALLLKVSRETIYTWASQEDKREFSDIVKSINIKQEQQLIQNGLSNKFNPTITKLLLGKHGYHDKQDIGGTDTPVKVDISTHLLKAYGDDSGASAS